MPYTTGIQHWINMASYDMSVARASDACAVLGFLWCTDWATKALQWALELTRMGHLVCNVGYFVCVTWAFNACVHVKLHKQH